MRTKLPRRQALELLRVIAKNAKNMIVVWSWTKHMERYGPTDPAQSNEEWRRLELFATAMERQARALRELAEEMQA